jgi:Chemotaxis response regulator containing a CheY-like receiver domain and a methylesterase domain
MAEIEAVLIGASAGGLKPLKEIVSTLPADFPAVLFIAQHVDPRSQPMLVNILQKTCKLPIRYPMDEEFYMPSVVYVAPPGNHMLLTYRKVWIFPANFVYLPKPNIDLMFQSAANEFRERSIGVLLSGTGTDGAIGIKAIKERGGTTIVQSEGSAEHFDMPRAAIETGAVDYRLPAEVIGSTIARIVAGDQADRLK